MTHKQERFVQEYLIDLNATRAAIRSGFSANNAKQIGCQLLDKTRPEIERRQAELAMKSEVKREQVINELAEIGFSNIGDFVSWDADGRVTVKPSSRIPHNKIGAIKTIESHTTTDRDGKIIHKLKIQLHGKEAALAKLGDLGIFPLNRTGGKIENLQMPYTKDKEPVGLKALTKEERADLLRLLEKAHTPPPRVVGRGRGKARVNGDPFGNEHIWPSPRCFLTC